MCSWQRSKKSHTIAPVLCQYGAALCCNVTQQSLRFIAVVYTRYPDSPYSRISNVSMLVVILIWITGQNVFIILLTCQQINLVILLSFFFNFRKYKNLTVHIIAQMEEGSFRPHLCVIWNDVSTFSLLSLINVSSVLSSLLHEHPHARY